MSTDASDLRRAIDAFAERTLKRLEAYSQEFEKEIILNRVGPDLVMRGVALDAAQIAFKQAANIVIEQQNDFLTWYSKYLSDKLDDMEQKEKKLGSV